jgi:Fe2+ or Zn2+ uptake regulation protein
VQFKIVGDNRIWDKRLNDFMGKETKFINRLEMELFEKHKFKIDSHQIYFYGLCERCR